MAEFVGIDPAGARRLIASMGDAVQRVHTLRPWLSASIAEAGTDWPAGPGAEVLEGVGRFLDETRRDLTWRTQTIERVEDADSQGGLRTAEFAFGDAAAARAAGTLAGKRTLSAWQTYQRDPSVQNWAKVQDALREGRGKTSDAAYAAGLLTTLGTGAFTGIFAAVSARNQNDARGYSPANLAKAKKDLGPLAEAFASTDAAGTLPGELRERALGDLPIAGMAALLGMARQSREFLLRAGTKLLQYSGSRVDGKDWNVYWLVKALSQDGKTTQRFLTTGDNAELLLRPEVVNGLEGTDFERLLATALEGALAPGAGDTTLRRDAWLNIIATLGRRNYWPSLTSGHARGEWLSASVPSPVGQVLAEHVSQYFPEFVAVWKKGHGVAGATVSEGWRKLDSEDVAGFFGGLFQGDGTLEPLKAGYGRFLLGLDLGREHPFGDASTESAREEQRTIFYGKAVDAGALASVFFSGLHEADLSAEAANEIIADFLLLPVDALVGWGTGEMISKGVWAGVTTGKTADAVGKNDLKDVVAGLLKEGEHGEASDLIDVLVDSQLSAFNLSRRAHGKTPLGESDLRQLKDLFYGRMESVLKDALKARGG